MSLFRRIVFILAMGLTLVTPALYAADPHGGAHPDIDTRLVPIPPSKDTIISAVWVLVIFIVMLMILYPTAWRNVLTGLKKREERIRTDIAEAEAARAKSEATLKEYTQQLAAAEARGREMIAAATTQGEKLATQIRMTAQQEAEETKNRATKDIEAARDAAIRDVHTHAANLATLIAEKIVRRNLNDKDQEDLVQESLKQLGSISKN